ncbi:hypothetical protein [Roseovarius aestuariivivens]|uniref:hypothetical protein n=1 Tax=Roseovarius aestuariivivens TaxID=1888910 RepID=UPI001080A5A7|nr:hypothetical protein [Roseovarius aestuariivivens]
MKSTVHEMAWIHFDGHARSKLWPIADYKERGIFTGKQVEDLASRFDLSVETASKLSLWIGNTLDVESLMNLAEVVPEKAIVEGTHDLRRALRHVAAQPETSNNRKKLEKVLLESSSCFAGSEKDAARLNHAQKLARDPETALEQLIAAARDLLDRPGSVARLSPSDKRRLYDGRRDHVVRSCCYAWLDAGRELTYTTRPDYPAEAQRGGPLFEFIHAVMGFVLTKDQLPSDETIRKDIDRFRDLIDRRPELLDGR